MALPDPEPGLVISYSYLWHSESVRGKEDGVKDRPCAVVISTQDEYGKPLVSVLPITHTTPLDPDDAIEIPDNTKTRLGLSDSEGERSWVVLSERNRFIWPGPDIRPISRNNSDIVYGHLPPDFYEELKTKLLALIRKTRIVVVERTE